MTPEAPPPHSSHENARETNETKETKQKWPAGFPTDQIFNFSFLIFRYEARLLLRREWGLAPLCGAVATFSGYSKDPSRPGEGGFFIFM